MMMMMMIRVMMIMMMIVVVMKYDDENDDDHPSIINLALGFLIVIIYYLSIYLSTLYMHSYTPNGLTALAKSVNFSVVESGAIINLIYTLNLTIDRCVDLAYHTVSKILSYIIHSFNIIIIFIYHQNDGDDDSVYDDDDDDSDNDDYNDRWMGTTGLDHLLHRGEVSL